MPHCHECIHGLPVWSINFPYNCPQSTIQVHPVPPFGPANSPASVGITIATSMSQAPLVFMDYVIQVYGPTTAFHTISFVSPNSSNTMCANENPAIYNGTGNVERVRPSVNPNNSRYTIANGCYNVPLLNNTPLIGTYCWADVIDGLNLVNDFFGWLPDFTYTMNWKEVADNMQHYSPGDTMKVVSILCSCEQGPCYCQACVDSFGGTGFPNTNCIYSSVDIQLCIDSAAATPCCVPEIGFKKASFSECREELERHLLIDGGTPIKTNNVKYEPSLGNYSLGDCVYDPKDKMYKCCTFDGQSDLLRDKTIACRIVNGKFMNDYGIWRSCERPPMLWDCVSGVGSCDNVKSTSNGYVGSFTSISQVDEHYENVEPKKNINNTHFDLSLSPTNLSLSESDYDWCTSITNKYTYKPKYRLLVTDKLLDTSNVYIETLTFQGLIIGITESYPGIKVNSTMKFNKIKSVLKEHIDSSEFCRTKLCSFSITIGILPQPIKDYQLNCNCKQTMTGKYKTELECLTISADNAKETKVAPTGFHYMPDGTLMSGTKHKTTNPKTSSTPITSSITSSSSNPSASSIASSSTIPSSNPSSSSSTIPSSNPSSSSSSSSESSGYL